MTKWLLLPLLLFFTGCRTTTENEAIVSMQLLDRNGFSETISNQDRLHVYEEVDFLAAQPYEKVLRVYNKNNQGKSPSKLTSYHDNGGAWQYLEALDGRANGAYMEWHENGKMKISGYVIEGLADLSPTAQTSWLFDGPCSAWDEEGNLAATFTYDKGHLTDVANYYYPDGTLQQTIPYHQGAIHGKLQSFDQAGNLLQEIPYTHGKRDGSAQTFFPSRTVQSKELYKEDLLFEGNYYDQEGNPLCSVTNGTGKKAYYDNNILQSLVEFNAGEPEGTVQLLRDNQPYITYSLKDGMKTGEEWEYYSDQTPKISIEWFEDQIQGMVKTWYPNGKLESQREMSNNKKHGISFGYYKTGDLMLMEEYDNDTLLKGSYYKRGDPTPVSTIEEGTGTATLFNPEGHFLQKAQYEKGKPVAE